MALIELFIQWSGDGIAHNDGGEDFELYSGTLFEFDTVARTVSTRTLTQRVFLTPVPDTPPADFSYDTNLVLVRYTSGREVLYYHHDSQGGLDIRSLSLEVTHIVVASTCFAGNNASISLQIGGLPGPFEILWDDGFTTQNRVALPAGTYRVSVRDVPTGAVVNHVVSVGENPELVVVIQKNGGNVTLQVSGGTPGYTYLWSDGITTRDRTGLPDGTYLCTITDSLGCAKTVSVQVFNNRFYWSRNPITLPLDAGPAYRLDPTTKPNLTFLCQVWIEPEYLSGTFVQVGTAQEQPADAQGRTVFEVQALLEVYLQHHVPAPEATGVTRADPMFRRFYLKYAESFGNPPVAAGTTTLALSYVVLGGLNFYESRARTWFNSYQDQVMPFLTWEPLGKPVLVDQPEYLYYMVKQSLAGFWFRARVMFADGTTQYTSTYGTAGPVLQHEVYCLAVGWQALNLTGLEAAQQQAVLWWEVFVTAPDGVTLLSEVRRYEADRHVYPNRRFFLYGTSLGGMATYVTTGKAVVDVEVRGEELSLTLPPHYDPLAGDTAVLGRELRPVVKAASGPHKTLAEQLATQDLLLSRRVLLLSREGRWLPGFLKAKTLTLVDESKPVPTLDIEFYLSRERLYTPALGTDQAYYRLP